MNLPRFQNILRQTRVFPKVSNSKRLIACRNAVKLQRAAVTITTQRLVSTADVKSDAKEGDSFTLKILKKIPFLNIEYIKAKSVGYLLYENLVDQLDYVELFEKYHLPDTFYSWFAITELHIWMVSARVMAEGKLGEIIRNSLVEALWADVAKRTKKLGEVNPSILRAQVQELSEQLQTAFIGYDEGLQSDDIVLAGVIWRRVYQMQYASPHHIEDIVRYIRKHMALLDGLSKEQVMEVHPVKWELIDNV